MGGRHSHGSRAGLVAFRHIKSCQGANMSEKESGNVPSDGKGGAIGAVCSLMMILSVIGAVIGAAQFTKVPVVSAYSSYTRLEHDPLLVLFWLAGGAGSVAFWYALSGIGTILQWLERNHRESARVSGIRVETGISGSPQPASAPGESVQPSTSTAPEKGYIRRGRRSM